MAFADSGASQMIAARFDIAVDAPVRSVRGEQDWHTASAGTFPETSPGELTALGEHASECEKQRGRLFSVQCAFDTLEALMAARFWTTMLVVASLAGIMLAYFA